MVGTRVGIWVRCHANTEWPPWASKRKIRNKVFKKSIMGKAEEIARGLLFDEVELLKVIDVGNCKLTIWRTTRRLSPMRLVVCDNGQEVYAASVDMSSYRKFLKDVRPPFNDLVNATELMDLALPRRLGLLPVSESHDSINEETGRRPPPQMMGTEFVFYCNDSVSGKVLRFSCNSDYELDSEIAGDGYKWDY